MTHTKVILALFFLGYSALAEVDTQVKKFEDLFVWKISDELKLTQKEESIVAEIIKDTNRKKQRSNVELESLYKKLNEETSESGKKTQFNKIRALHKAQLKITLEELDRLNKGVGLKRLGQYLEVKRDLSEKIKNAWSQTEKKSDKELPPPKVIEEK
jgi:hypothetical protein